MYLLRKLDTSFKNILVGNSTNLPNLKKIGGKRKILGFDQPEGGGFYTQQWVDTMLTMMMMIMK